MKIFAMVLAGVMFCYMIFWGLILSPWILVFVLTLAIPYFLVLGRLNGFRLPMIITIVVILVDVGIAVLFYKNFQSKVEYQKVVNRTCDNMITQVDITSDGRAVLLNNTQYEISIFYVDEYPGERYDVKPDYAKNIAHDATAMLNRPYIINPHQRYILRFTNNVEAFRKSIYGIRIENYTLPNLIGIKTLKPLKISSECGLEATLKNSVFGVGTEY